MSYTREVTMPKTRREGLANFVQIIINYIEAGDSREALLHAVALLDDIRSGQYDDAMTDAAGYSAIIREAEKKHSAEIIAAGQAGYDQGVQAEKDRMAKALRLVGAEGRAP